MSPTPFAWSAEEIRRVGYRVAELVAAHLAGVPARRVFVLRTDGDERGVQGPPWFSAFGIEQTRPFRSLKIWAALKHFGLDGYREMIGHDVALARYLAGQVRARPELELWTPQGLSIVCFRMVPPELARQADALDALNRQVLQEVQLGGEAFLSGVVNPRAAESDVAAMLGSVLRTAAWVRRRP